MNFPPRIVVAMADDPYIFWFLPFLETFRTHNPDLPLYVVPYSDDCDAVARLRPVYGFEFIDVPEMAEIQRVAEEVHGVKRQTALYRRLAAHALPVDEFLYLDSDNLVFADLSPFFGHTAKGLDLAYATNSPNETYRAEARARFPDSHMFSSGMYLSSPARLPFADLAASLCANGALLREVEGSASYDQSFLNLHVDLSGASVAGLYGLQDRWSPMVWVNYPELQRTETGFRESPEGRPVAVVHWAGVKVGGPKHRHMDVLMDYHLRGRARLKAAGVTLPGDAG